jgi:hypothetical protein
MAQNPARKGSVAALGAMRAIAERDERVLERAHLCFEPVLIFYGVRRPIFQFDSWRPPLMIQTSPSFDEDRPLRPGGRNDLLQIETN